MITARRPNRHNLSPVGFSALAATALFAAPALAQQEAPAGQGLDEIVVTAEKREENLQNVPIAVTAMTGDTLTATGISNVEDLQFFVPGVSITNDSMAIINIRGIGTSAFGVATDPSTTVHYDGVYIARPTTSYQDMFDVERIEVLRGPQGVLFGRNSAGGTLNIISKMPSRELTGTLGVTIGNYDKRTFSGTVSGPLSESTRARLTLVKNDRPGSTAMSLQTAATRMRTISPAGSRLRSSLRTISRSCCAPTAARTARPAIPQSGVPIRQPSRRPGPPSPKDAMKSRSMQCYATTSMPGACRRQSTMTRAPSP